MKMNTTAVLSLLLLSITGAVCAQDSNYKQLPPEEKIFALPPFSIKRTYHADLAKGNKFQLEIGDPTDVGHLQNIDSILMVFLSDLKAFHDSLSDPLTVKRIDYLIESSGRKKLRLRQFRPAAATFLLEGKEPAQLRLRQDTIYIILLSAHGTTTRYDRFAFFINSYDELENLVTTGLNEKVRLMRDGIKWRNRLGHSSINETDPSVTEDQYNIDQLQFDIFMNAQNYKNYFVPSVGLGATIRLFRGYNEHEFGAYWEPNFFFSTNTQGHLETLRNDFIIFHYGYDRSDNKHKPSKETGLYTNISIGYLIQRQGEYFNKHTFRLSVGDMEFKGGKILLQPLIYFNDFFRGVTPGLRLSFRAL
jgi:hypothetical protein